MISLPPDLPGVVEILLVEDNPRDAELALRALKRHNLANHVVWVRDGAEALDFIFGPSADSSAPINRSPKLVLLDLKLPKVDGHEVLHRLKSDARTRAIPVVVLTSSREEADPLRAYELATLATVDRTDLWTYRTTYVWRVLSCPKCRTSFP